MTRPRSSLASEAAACLVLDAEIRFTHQPFVKPLILSTDSIESISTCRANLGTSNCDTATNAEDHASSVNARVPGVG